MSRELRIFTGQISKPYSDMVFVLDITVKSGDKTFAPTWGMVIGYKQKSLSSADYTSRYEQMMAKSRHDNHDRWHEVIDRGAASGGLMLVCYCPKGQFCHRHLLKGYVADMAQELGYEVEIVPEL